MQPIAIRYRTPDGEHCEAPAYVGESRFLESFWRVTASARLVAELHLMPPLPAHARHRRELAARGRRRYPNGFGVTGRRARHLNTRRSSSLIAVSAPPHRQPESSISRLGASCSSSVDQWPQTTVHAGRCAVLVREPRPEARGRRGRAALLPEIHRAVGGAEAQPRARVDDDAQPVEARRGRRATRAARRRRARAGSRRRGRPRASPAPRATARAPARASTAGSRPACTSSRSPSTTTSGRALQPAEQLVAIGGLEDRRERVAAVRLRDARRRRSADGSRDCRAPWSRRRPAPSPRAARRAIRARG